MIALYKVLLNSSDFKTYFHHNKYLLNNLFKNQILPGTKNMTDFTSLESFTQRFVQKAESFRNKTHDCLNELVIEFFTQPVYSKP